MGLALPPSGASADPTATPTPGGAPPEGLPQLPDASGPRDCLPGAQTVYRPAPWAQQRLAPQRLWSLTRGGGVTVAVVDSGVDGGVRQLAGKVSAGVDVRTRQRADSDCVGHGTFVAGLIAASPVDGTGFAGLAPGVRILPVRVTTAADGRSADLARGIRDAADAGAKVINVSIAAEQPSAELEAAVAYAAGRDAVVVAAVANQKQSGNPRTYPAAYPSVVAVGAVDRGDAPASFSESGSYVDLAAPGVDMVSLGPRGNGHLQGSGTSFAAPLVAATAALVRSYHPRLSAAQVRHRLEVTADHPGRAVPDPELGWGVVNPYAAVTSVLPEESGPVRSAAAAPVVVPPTPPRAGMTARTVAFAVAGAVAVGVGVVWLCLLLGPRRRRRTAGVTVG
ncbi:type VII secretion-associated serine protease mycosin [Planosporangium thailandense]|uniref:Type VII secretion-associated serine protease mycosin n=2 Tax=Planosporangium thailandense TaxID=765197 RepID=A0ABX0Y104_9ACTN|nr:type VII secretion-associated serine protease mycosin [Planosporangium thailandense]NJC72031.1 type VII secretion-associated serine protease mycosin [Planosporangium thailandense]